MKHEFFTMRSLADYCAAKLAEHPEWADEHIEIRSFLLAKPPQYLEYDPATRTWILVGVN